MLVCFCVCVCVLCLRKVHQYAHTHVVDSDQYCPHNKCCIRCISPLSVCPMRDVAMICKKALNIEQTNLKAYTCASIPKRSKFSKMDNFSMKSKHLYVAGVKIFINHMGLLDFRRSCLPKATFSSLLLSSAWPQPPPSNRACLVLHKSQEVHASIGRC